MKSEERSASYTLPGDDNIKRIRNSDRRMVLPTLGSVGAAQAYLWALILASPSIRGVEGSMVYCEVNAAGQMRKYFLPCDEPYI